MMRLQTHLYGKWPIFVRSAGMALTLMPIQNATFKMLILPLASRELEKFFEGSESLSCVPKQRLV